MRILVVLAAALLVGACTTATQDSDPDTGRISLTMTEFAFAPEPVTVAAGQEVTLVLTNDGEIAHEFMAGRDPMPDDGGYREELFAGVSPAVTPPGALAMDAHDAHAGFMVKVEPGQTVEVVFTLPEERAGAWEIGCFEPGHYQAGMHATLTVTS